MVLSIHGNIYVEYFSQHLFEVILQGGKHALEFRNYVNSAKWSTKKQCLELFLAEFLNYRIQSLKIENSKHFIPNEC